MTPSTSGIAAAVLCVLIAALFAPDEVMRTDAPAPAVLAPAPDALVRHVSKYRMCLEILYGHEDKDVMELAIGSGNTFPPPSPNHAGSKLASGSDDKTVKIWSARGEDDILECQATFRGHTRAVCGVAWNATDSILASCSLDTSVRLWNSDTGAELPALCGHGKAVSSLAFKPNDPEILVTGSWDRTLKCWNVSTGECLCTLMTKHTDWIMTVAWSWDGTKLASGSRDKTVKVWSRGADDKFECQSTLSGHTDSVRGVAFHPTKDHVLVSCSLDTKIILWNMDTGAQLAILEGHTGRVQAVAFKNDGTQVASASWDKTARIWDLQGGMQLAAKAHSSLMEEEDRGSDKKAHACAEPKR